MIHNSKLEILFSVLLFLMMTLFSISSYASPCHDAEVGVGLNSVDNVDFIAPDSFSIVQNEKDCKNCIGACGLCKSHIQSQPVLSYIEDKNKSGLNDYKNTNYSLQSISEITLTTYKATYKPKHLYPFSLLPALQTTLKYRILLV